MFRRSLQPTDVQQGHLRELGLQHFEGLSSTEAKFLHATSIRYLSPSRHPSLS